MPVYNAEIAETLNRVADLLEIEGANQFRVRAYRRAARTINGHPRRMADLVEEGADLTKLAGIGEDMAGKIQELVRTGELEQLRALEERVPSALAEMLKLAGLGPKRVQQLYAELRIDSLEKLRAAAQHGEMQELEGLGPKTQAAVLDDLERQDTKERRTRLSVAEQMVEPLVAYLRDDESSARVEVAGSYPPRKENLGDLDILVTSEDGADVLQRFVEYEDVEDVAAHGETRSTVRLRPGIQVDLRVLGPESYGAALLYFTGSKAHNIALRNMAAQQGLKINEYGVFQGEERVAGETEDEIYHRFNLASVPPELREDRGELEAAAEGRLPNLIELEQIRGDLQTHSTGSDGEASLEKMARAAQERGYAYLAITDHSPRVAVAQGLDAEALAQQMDEIDRLNQELETLVLLKGVEVDILGDGSLDLPDSSLEKLDVCICSVHSHFDLPEEEQTERIIRALDNPHVHLLAHPTGRRIGERAPYAVNLERVMEAALERGCFLEINAQPERLDLRDVHVKMARDMGLKLAINTDAHSVADLDWMRFGVDQARRGWLEAQDVLNTRSWSDLQALLTR